MKYKMFLLLLVLWCLFAAPVFAQADGEVREATFIAPHIGVGVDQHGLEFVTVLNAVNMRAESGSGFLYSYRRSDGRWLGVTEVFGNGEFTLADNGATGILPSGFVTRSLFPMPSEKDILQTGYAVFRTNERYFADCSCWKPDFLFTVTFLVRDASSGAVLSAVDTEVGRADTRFTLALLESPTTDLALAFANPNDQPAEISILVRSDIGIERAVQIITLGPGEQLPRFLPEIMQGNIAWQSWVQAAIDLGWNTHGTLEITSTLPVALTALRTDTSPEGGFVMSGWKILPPRH